MSSPSLPSAEYPDTDESAQRELLSATMQEALPLLQYVHDTQKIMAFMPPKSSGLDQKPLAVLPFYMNRTDPSNVGVWEIRQDNEPPVRISAVPDGRSNNTVFNFTQKVKTREAGKPEVQPMPLDTAFGYATALRAAAGQLQLKMTAEKARAEAKSSRGLRHIVQVLHRHGIA